LTFDHLVHTYDISPGEDTLERTHPSPPDPHTYEELPIIKFDGWEECDEEQPEDRVVRNMDPVLVEEGINQWLAIVAEYNEQPVQTLKDLLATSGGVSDQQFHDLRAILSNEEDKDRVALIKKIWSVVLPKKELDLLFGEKEEKLLSTGEHH